MERRFPDEKGKRRSRSKSEIFAQHCEFPDDAAAIGGNHLETLQVLQVIQFIAAREGMIGKDGEAEDAGERTKNNCEK